MIEKKPILGHLLQIICTMINSDNTGPSKNSVESYSLDALSDEEMELENVWRCFEYTCYFNAEFNIYFRMMITEAFLQMLLLLLNWQQR